MVSKERKSVFVANVEQGTQIQQFVDSLLSEADGEGRNQLN